MLLENLESAIRPNFIWKDDPVKRLQTNSKIEGGIGVGIIVFIGVAYSCGFRKKEITDYLDISSEEYETKFHMFKTAMEQAIERKNNGGLFRKLTGKRLEWDLPYKVYTKTCLVITYIRLNYPAPKYFRLIDMGY